MTRPILCVLFVGALFITAPQPAYAYIDPGMGSLLFQSAVAGFVAVGAAWVGLKMKILSFFDRKEKKLETEQQK